MKKYSNLIIVIILFQFNSFSQITSTKLVYEELPSRYKVLVGENGISEKDLLFLVNEMQSADYKDVFLSTLNLTEGEYSDYCFCLIEKEVMNHVYLGNNVFSGLFRKEAELYGEQCIKKFIPLIQERSGNFNKSYGLTENDVPYWKVESLYNLNGFSESFVKGVYGTCMNNKSLREELKMYGYSKIEYDDYCECLINKIVKQNNYYEMTEDMEKFKSKSEKYAVECFEK